jgi:hypothetical protein
LDESCNNSCGGALGVESSRREVYKLLFWMGKRDVENFPVADFGSTNGRM